MMSLILSILLLALQHGAEANGIPPTVIVNDNIDYMGPECPKGCPRILSPVCAIDRYGNFHYFQNDCLRRTQQCEEQRAYFLTKMSYCMDESEKAAECLYSCSNELKPVCARNGQKFEMFCNQCYFNMVNCFANGNWTRVNLAYCIFIKS